MLVAGGETTDKAIANLWWNLLSNPDALAAVTADPDRLDAAFSESMRKDGPVQFEDRFTTTEVEWYGVTVPAGARVRVCVASANNDDSVFTDPRRFDLDRPDLWLRLEKRSGTHDADGRHGHLGFGIGKHFCLGYELARTESVIGSRRLLEAMGEPRLARRAVADVPRWVPRRDVAADDVHARLTALVNSRRASSSNRADTRDTITSSRCGRYRTPTHCRHPARARSSAPTITPTTPTMTRAPAPRSAPAAITPTDAALSTIAAPWRRRQAAHAGGETGTTVRSERRRSPIATSRVTAEPVTSCHESMPPRSTAVTVVAPRVGCPDLTQ